MTARTLRFGGTSYPLILPNIRDPRLHVAAVIITVHVLGQVGLHFWVSVPQVLAAILTCAILEVAITFRQSRAFVWPASAMLTGSGVALIMRVVGTQPDDPWSTYAWHVFAIVAGLSLLSKYVIRYRGSHVFNPSNVGLVVAFIVLGTTRVEPLDFWWAPLNPFMLAAYAVILVGGLLITRRLKLLALAAAFWVTLAVGLGTLAASGHCMTARWAFAPVCGFDYWRVIVTSPEVMIFLFFMITDPKTVPSGAVGRVVFGVLVGVVSTLLMAPQTDEFGTKVALLSGLVAVCAARPLLDRVLPEPGSTADRMSGFAGRLLRGQPAIGVARGAARTGLIVAAVLVVGVGIVAAGTPARAPVAIDASDVLDRVPHQVDPNTFPAITVNVEAWDGGGPRRPARRDAGSPGRGRDERSGHPVALRLRCCERGRDLPVRRADRREHRLRVARHGHARDRGRHGCRHREPNRTVRAHLRDAPPGQRSLAHRGGPPIGLVGIRPRA